MPSNDVGLTAEIRVERAPVVAGQEGRDAQQPLIERIGIGSGGLVDPAIAKLRRQHLRRRQGRDH